MQNTIIVISANTLYILLAFVIVSIIVLYVEVITRIRNASLCGNMKNNNSKRKSLKKKAPGPRALPIIGNLAALDGYEVPYQAFTDLSKKYGSVISLQLGNVPALVVNDIENIREVLITKTSHFDSRPNFRRYHQLFSGNKENSLAFCDWSDLHKLRREMLTPHTFPRNYSNRFQELNTTIVNEIKSMMTELTLTTTTGASANVAAADASVSFDLNKFDIKYWLLRTSANIFTQYFCSRKFNNNDLQFDKLIRNFDKIFYEVNQGYAADFLPFLMPLHKKNLNQMAKWSHEIREIIEERIIEDRFETTVEENDYVDSFIMHINESRLPSLERDTALFALEDIIGGHAAVGNFLTKVFAYLIQYPEVQEKIHKEVDAVLGETGNENFINLEHRNQMQYTQAVIMEALRLIASPIVPHVSNQDTTVNGYDVEANTLVFLNNYELSMSPKLWENPEDFKPERFLRNGHLTKPDYFLPFGAGRRSCMGYKLVQFISFSILANIMKDYKISPLINENYKVQIGSLAVPEDSYRVSMESRV